MTPDELRALADALLPMAAAPCFDGIDIERAAAYLRAQADAQPTPAAPQVEPIDPHMIVADDRFPDAQAEPKREPLTYEQLVSACYTYRHDFGLLDPDEQHLVIEEAGRWAKAFGIGGSDAD